MQKYDKAVKLSVLIDLNMMAKPIQQFLPEPELLCCQVGKVLYYITKKLHNTPYFVT